jgi:hypothetical protein
LLSRRRRQASKLLRRRSGSRGSGLSPWSHQAGACGAVSSDRTEGTCHQPLRPRLHHAEVAVGQQHHAARDCGRSRRVNGGEGRRREVQGGAGGARVEQLPEDGWAGVLWECGKRDEGRTAEVARPFARTTEGALVRQVVCGAPRGVPCPAHERVAALALLRQQGQNDRGHVGDDESTGVAARPQVPPVHRHHIAVSRHADGDELARGCALDSTVCAMRCIHKSTDQHDASRRKHRCEQAAPIEAGCGVPEAPERGFG